MTPSSEIRCSDKAFGIIRRRIVEHIGRLAGFHNIAALHDDDVMEKRADHLQVVADENVTEVVFAA